VLIWGTDETKPTGKTLKEVDAKLRDRLGKIFKWQNYFEVSRQNAGVLAGKAQGMKLGDECSVEVKILPENVAEVKLIGKGKTIVTRRHSLAKPDALVLAGDDQYDGFNTVLSRMMTGQFQFYPTSTIPTP